MKTVLAAAALALSVFVTPAIADDEVAPTVIVIEAVDAADAQQQIESLQRDIGSTGVIFVVVTTQPESLQRDIGSTGVIF